MRDALAAADRAGGETEPRTAGAEHPGGEPDQQDACRTRPTGGRARSRRPRAQTSSSSSAEVVDHREHDRRERLGDLDRADVADARSRGRRRRGTVQQPPDRGRRAEPRQVGVAGGDRGADDPQVRQTSPAARAAPRWSPRPRRRRRRCRRSCRRSPCRPAPNDGPQPGQPCRVQSRPGPLVPRDVLAPQRSPRRTRRACWARKVQRVRPRRVLVLACRGRSRGRRQLVGGLAHVRVRVAGRGERRPGVARTGIRRVRRVRRPEPPGRGAGRLDAAGRGPASASPARDPGGGLSDRLQPGAALPVDRHPRHLRRRARPPAPRPGRCCRRDRGSCRGSRRRSAAPDRCGTDVSASTAARAPTAVTSGRRPSGADGVSGGRARSRSARRADQHRRPGVGRCDRSRTTYASRPQHEPDPATVRPVARVGGVGSRARRCRATARGDRGPGDLSADGVRGSRSATSQRRGSDSRAQQARGPPAACRSGRRRRPAR